MTATIIHQQDRMTSNGSISRAEVWDDTDLVESWNSALDEYKKYHSIRARGEDVSQAINAMEKEGNPISGNTDHEAEPVNTKHLNDPRAKENISEETSDHGVISDENQSQVGVKIATAQEEASIKTPALPHHLIGQVHDEGLKNLLMSWYYAGYYTGLYEGRQQGKADSACQA